MVDLRVTLGSLQLANPVLAAAGTVGYGVEFARALPLQALGALIVKTLTRDPREGHPPPRLVETPAGMLNAVGLQNIGLTAFLSKTLPRLRVYGVPVIVSLLGESPEELAEMATEADRAEGIAAVELNLSCPNMKHRSGLGVEDWGQPQPSSEPRTPNPARISMVAQDAAATSAYVRAAVSATRKPVIAKLSPDVTDLVPIAQAAERAGASAITIGNTFTGMSLDATTRRSRLGAVTGGLSGPAIRPLAVYRVWYTARSVRVPIIGLGGIVRVEDAVEFFLAGATAVAVGTAHFADPRAAARIVRGLSRYLHRHQVTSIQDLRGAMKQPAE